jgi:hypothetical protein
MSSFSYLKWIDESFCKVFIVQSFHGNRHPRPWISMCSSWWYISMEMFFLWLIQRAFLSTEQDTNMLNAPLGGCRSRGILLQDTWPLDTPCMGSSRGARPFYTNQPWWQMPAMWGYCWPLGHDSWPRRQSWVQGNMLASTTLELLDDPGVGGSRHDNLAGHSTTGSTAIGSGVNTLQLCQQNQTDDSRNWGALATVHCGVPATGHLATRPTIGSVIPLVCFLKITDISMRLQSIIIGGLSRVVLGWGVVPT